MCLYNVFKNKTTKEYYIDRAERGFVDIAFEQGWRVFTQVDTVRTLEDVQNNIPLQQGEVVLDQYEFANMLVERSNYY